MESYLWKGLGTGGGGRGAVGAGVGSKTGHEVCRVAGAGLEHIQVFQV